MSTNFCSTIGGNTGKLRCDGKRKVPKKPVVGSRVFTYAEYSDPDVFMDAIIESINLSNGDPDKLFPFPEVAEVANNTEADTTGSLALGPVIRLKKGRPSYTYTVDIGHYQFQKLLAFDNKVVPVFLFDDAAQWWAYRPAAPSNTRNTRDISGEMALVTISGNGFEDGANAATGKCTITFSYLSIDDFEKRSAYGVLTNMSAGDLEGLVDIMLSEATAHTTNAYKIKVTIPGPVLGQELDVYDDYAAGLAALTWTAKTGATFSTSLTITSVAVDATLKALTVTFDSTAYTALANGAEIKLTPPSVATLVGANIVGYEIGDIILVKS
jgi:hypothetical protein